MKPREKKRDLDSGRQIKHNTNHELLNSTIWTGNEAKIQAIVDQHEAQRKKSVISTAVDK